VEKGLPFRISEKWATIGDENRPWHIHLNMDEVVQARFVKEPRSDEGQSYSIRFFDSKGNLSMRANFTKMYDGNGNLIKEKVANFVEAIINMADQVIPSLNHNHTRYPSQSPARRKKKRVIRIFLILLMSQFTFASSEQ
jgi:hypothetical protein